MKKVATLLVLALAAVTLVACGGGDDDTSATTAETTAESTEAGGAGGGAEGGGEASVVEIEAAEGTDLAYAQKEVTAKAGDVTIEFTNPQSLSHDVVVEDASGKKLGQTELIASDKTTATISGLKPGKDTFYCSVPGHREAGMEGTFTVE
jgi:plastocyanin